MSCDKIKFVSIHILFSAPSVRHPFNINHFKFGSKSVTNSKQNEKKTFKAQEITWKKTERDLNYQIKQWILKIGDEQKY